MSNPKYDAIIVCDIEMTCWESKEAQGSQPSEIIEIGICRLKMDTFEITDRTSIIIRPKYSEITKYCTKLTGLTKKKVRAGIPFGDACNRLAKKYGTRNRTWASWGDGDRICFEKECSDKGVKYLFGISHINASALFSLMLGHKKRISVPGALEIIEQEFVGQQHCAADDAYNTAIILRYLFYARKVASQLYFDRKK